MPRLLCPGNCTPCHLPAFLPVSCPGYSAKSTEHPASCMPVCLLERLLCPRLLHTLPPACLPVCWPGYTAQNTPHPATCLLGAQATLPRLVNTLHPACLFTGQATLPRLMHTLPPACLPVCLPGYSAQQSLPPDCLPACVLARLFCPGYSAKATAHPATCLPACLQAWLLCPGYYTPCTCLLGANATLPRLLNTLPTACLPVCWPGYSAKATAHPADCLPT